MGKRQFKPVKETGANADIRRTININKVKYVEVARYLNITPCALYSRVNNKNINLETKMDIKKAIVRIAIQKGDKNGKQTNCGSSCNYSD